MSAPHDAVTDEDRHAWERPGAFEVAPGVHRIPLPLPGDALKAVNVYAVPDGDRVVLIDAGWALTEARELLSSALGTLGYRLADVREFLVTHLHRDHYTQAVALRREFGNSIALGEGEQQCLELIRTVTANPDVDRLRVAGAPELADEVEAWGIRHDLADWEDPDRWLADSQQVPLQTRTLHVIATPGHTRGHVVFHDPQHGTLFAGDHVLPHITPSIGVELNRPPSPLRDYLASLRLVRAMPDARLLPAHGPVAPSVHARIDELLAHHEHRLAETAEVLDKGAQTAYEAARILPWTRHERRLTDLDLFNRILAVFETMAHLVVLVDRGEITRTDIDGVAHFARA